MSLRAESAARTGGAAGTAGLARVRRASLATLVLVVAEYVIGMYVNLYSTVPEADHGQGLGAAIGNGPVLLSIHAVIGLLLGLGALGVAWQAVRSRRAAVIAWSAVGLLALAMATVAGAGFTNTGDRSASMAMSVLTGVALLCYAANIYLVRPQGTGTGTGG
ncbi:MAG TPA: hypothetical protein VFJ07_07315 [Streptosporangiaceae bacterium]|nr:hypothetical protein [Streptosporangiaceae bacterium]